MKKRCRHERNSWIIMAGSAEWCYVCGAYRNLRRISETGLTPSSAWRKPSGDPKNNPWERVERENKNFEKRNKQ